MKKNETAKSDLGVQENTVTVNDTMFRGYNPNECVMLNVVDNGFYPLICKGDTVVLHRQTTAENGEIAVVCIDGSDEAVLRRVNRTADGMILTADNESETNCKPIVLKGEQEKRVRIFGKVLWMFRDMK